MKTSNKERKNFMDYTPIIKKIEYWKNYKGKGDEYRKTHDLDCILTGGNLYADTIFSLWLPLRYTLNYFEHYKWTYWKEYEADVLFKKNMKLKDCDEFLLDLKNNISVYLPNHEITENLIKLFDIGQRRCNVMILPERNMNTERGKRPYFDYLPHYLYDLLSDENSEKNRLLKNWIEEENLYMFFNGGVIEKENIIDLANTGAINNHLPKNISLSSLLNNYIMILQQREHILSRSA